MSLRFRFFFFFQAEDGIRDSSVTGVQTCALPISKAAEALGKVLFLVKRIDEATYRRSPRHEALPQVGQVQRSASRTHTLRGPTHIDETAHWQCGSTNNSPGPTALRLLTSAPAICCWKESRRTNRATLLRGGERHNQGRPQ